MSLRKVTVVLNVQPNNLVLDNVEDVVAHDGFFQIKRVIDKPSDVLLPFTSVRYISITTDDLTNGTVEAWEQLEAFGD